MTIFFWQSWYFSRIFQIELSKNLISSHVLLSHSTRLTWFVENQVFLGKGNKMQQIAIFVHLKAIFFRNSIFKKLNMDYFANFLDRFWNNFCGRRYTLKRERKNFYASPFWKFQDSLKGRQNSIYGLLI